MLADYSYASVSEDIAGLAANLSVYRDSFSLLVEQLEEYIPEEIADELRHARYAFGEVIDTLDTASMDMLDAGRFV
jgi:hypothetical protein